MCCVVVLFSQKSVDASVRELLVCLCAKFQYELWVCDDPPEDIIIIIYE